MASNFRNSASRLGAVTFFLVTAGMALAATTPPKPISTVAPEHPEKLYSQGIEGSATVKFRVDVDGSVSDAVVTEATDPAFGEAAVAAVSQWKLEPAVRDGNPVAIKVAQTFQFTIPPEKRLEILAGRPVFVPAPESVVEAKKLKTRPIPIVPPRPVYPKSLLGSGKEGMVRIKFTITEEGLPVNPEILDTKGDEVFATYALISLLRGRWEPIEHKGKVTAVSMTLPMRFSETAPPQGGRGGQGGRGTGGGGGRSGGGGGGGVPREGDF